MKVVAVKVKSMVLMVFKFFSTFVFACDDNMIVGNVLLLLNKPIIENVSTLHIFMNSF